MLCRRELAKDTEHMVRAFIMVTEMIQDAPTVDAVEVVRKPVKDYEGYYEVDQFGRVFGLDRTIIVVDGERRTDNG